MVHQRNRDEPLGEITPLAAMCQPHVAVITTIGSAHIGHMGSIAAITEEKACLIAQLQPNGIAVVPDDAKGQACFEAAAKTSGAIPWKCGEQPDTTARLLDLVQTDIGSSSWRPSTDNFSRPPLRPWKTSRTECAFPLAAIIAAGGDGEKAAQALGTFRPGNGRGARREILGGSVTLLDESYNASVPAILAALEVLRITQANDASQSLVTCGSLVISQLPNIFPCLLQFQKPLISSVADQT
jgi:UDP-N-acetylmuramoyl-tripeptide--D-alanyl-D-alanine ligase